MPMVYKLCFVKAKGSVLLRFLMRESIMINLLVFSQKGNSNVFTAHFSVSNMQPTFKKSFRFRIFP